MKRILIIDDDSIIGRTYEALLKNYFDEKHQKYETEFIPDANVAFRRVLENNFNLAIVDLNLKNSDFSGIDIARECILAGKPVIICSGSNLLFKLKSYLDLKQFNNYIIHLDKPIDPIDLYETLDHLLHIKVNSKIIYEKITT